MIALCYLLSYSNLELFLEKKDLENDSSNVMALDLCWLGFFMHNWPFNVCSSEAGL